MRIWGKLWKDNHMIRDMVAEDLTADTRTHKVFHALEAVCREFDLSVPIWLESNISDFKRRKKVRFTRDSFIEEIDFDCLELEVLAED